MNNKGNDNKSRWTFKQFLHKSSQSQGAKNAYTSFSKNLAKKNELEKPMCQLCDKVGHNVQFCFVLRDNLVGKTIFP